MGETDVSYDDLERERVSVGGVGEAHFLLNEVIDKLREYRGAEKVAQVHVRYANEYMQRALSALLNAYKLEYDYYVDILNRHNTALLSKHNDALRTESGRCE